MAKPIPVFTFVFAAYAATSAEGQRPDAFAAAKSEPTADREEQELFFTTWRRLSRRGANLRVRVGVVVGESGARPTLAERGPDVEEIWLGEIAQTGRGFSGVPVATPERLRRVGPGEPIGFELRHIRGWTLDVEDKTAARGEREPRENSRTDVTIRAARRRRGALNQAPTCEAVCTVDRSSLTPGPIVEEIAAFSR